MKIKMLRSRMGSNDGATTKLYQEGESYDVSDALAESFIADKVAEMDDSEKAEAEPENKALPKAPKNKAEAAPENK